MAADRLPPQDIDTEVACLSSAFMSSDALARITEVLRSEDFYLERHRLIYTAILELLNKGMPVDLTTVKQRLSDQKLFDKIGGDAALVSIYQSESTSINASAYANRLRELSLRRKVIEVTAEAAEKCYDSARDTNEVIDEIEKDIFSVTERRIVSSYKPLEFIAKQTMEEIESLRKNKKSVTGTPTGFIGLDELLTGFHPSELIVIAARPGMGKTALGLNIVNNVAKKDPNRAILFFSLEMSATQLGMRLACIEAQVDSQRVRIGSINEEETKRLYSALTALGKRKINIDDTPGVNVMEIRAKARRLARENEISLIVVDYLQMMTSLSPRIDRHLQVAEMSRLLKQLARELSVPVIALAQLSRAVESRIDQRPILADLRESGAIEQDADVVMFIYREEKVKSEDKMNPEKKGIADIIVAKQRNGPVGNVELKYFDRFTKFDDLDNTHSDAAFESYPTARDL